MLCYVFGRKYLKYLYDVLLTKVFVLENSNEFSVVTKNEVEGFVIFGSLYQSKLVVENTLTMPMVTWLFTQLYLDWWLLQLTNQLLSREISQVGLVWVNRKFQFYYCYYYYYHYCYHLQGQEHTFLCLICWCYIIFRFVLFFLEKMYHFFLN